MNDIGRGHHDDGRTKAVLSTNWGTLGRRLGKIRLSISKQEFKG